MGSQILELRWANHKSNMTSELQELYLNDALFDVTIACGEFTLKAHKTVLSASSAFFRKLFIDNPCKHPILIMTDVDFGDLKAIVEFMYHGEIHVAREKLSHFLKIAEKLMVKGLSSIENINLNTPGDYKAVIYPHYSSVTREQLESKSGNVERNPSNPTDSVENSQNEEIPVIKLEDEASHTDSGNCMYWENDNCDQTSSSVVIPDYNLSDSSASRHLSFPTPQHKLSTQSVSHQLLIASVSDQLPTSVPHQLSPSSTSHEVADVLDKTESSSSHELGVPLSGDTFSHSDNQMDSMALVKLPEESTGIVNNSANLYLPQDKSSVNIPTPAKLPFEIKESSNNSSSQDEKTNMDPFKQCATMGTHVCSSQENRNFSNTTCRSANFNSCCSKMPFSNQDVPDNDTTMHPEPEKLICNICNKPFSFKCRLQAHLRMHSREKSFQCRVCSKRFIWHSELCLHNRIHTAGNLFLCKVCRKQFRRKYDLERHERTHTGEKPFFCKFCKKQFSRKDKLHHHEKTQHS